MTEQHKPKPEAVRIFGLNIIRCIHCGRPLQVGASDWEHVPGTPERSAR
jgi:hypothetical protein